MRNYGFGLREYNLDCREGTMTYEEAEETFATARYPEKGKPLQNNTRLFKRGDDYAVQLHHTDVVTIHRDGTYTIRTGGWETCTTKDRINTYAPVRLYSDRGIWYLWPSGYWNDKKLAKKRVLFEEDVRVGADGMPVKVSRKSEEGWVKKRRLMRKAVTDYIRGFVEHFQGKGFPLNENGCFNFAGDCLMCMAMPEKKVSPREFSLDHLCSHISEGYYVPTLYWRIVNWRGYREPASIFSIAHMRLERGEMYRRGSMIERDFEWFFRPLINELTNIASQGCPQIFVRQERREKRKRRKKVKV